MRGRKRGQRSICGRCGLRGHCAPTCHVPPGRSPDWADRLVAERLLFRARDAMGDMRRDLAALLREVAATGEVAE